MNERIKELAETAGLEFDDDRVLESEPIYYTTQKDLEKFAELLINECIRIVEGASDQYSGPVWADELINVMVEYFGVEE